MVVIHLHLLMFQHLSLAQSMQKLVIRCGFCSSSVLCCTFIASVLFRYNRAIRVGGGESNSARDFFKWPGCCLNWLLRLLACEFCPLCNYPWACLDNRRFL